MSEKNGKKRITFRLYAPEANEVYLPGTFNNWASNAQPLRRYSNGKWSTTITLEQGTHEYLFVIDGSWADDPQCTERIPNDFGGHNCLIRV
jgi:1,4-alpha-glucan branching enzyme